MLQAQDPLQDTLEEPGGAMAEWIERPLLMLEVRGSNPGHSASKNTTSLPQNPIGTHKGPGAASDP